MVNLGMDFGSTYTIVSIFREDTQMLEAIVLNQGLPFVPSVVALDNGQYEYGRAAKSRTGKKGVAVYKVFKMLLTETDKEKLRERGFDEAHTPEKIARIFIENVLRQILKDLQEDRIGKLVVGVPEIWNEGFGTVDGRTIIRNICRSLEFVDKVQVVSEPAAASAFFAHNFYLSTKENFEGRILLVDYGGGTLDITLTDVITVGDEEKNSVEIKVLERTGAGENEDRELGKAGIVYMENVMAQAILQAGAAQSREELLSDGKFYKAVDELEQELQDRTEKIQDVFEEYGLDDPAELHRERFTILEYRGEDVEISYGLLLDVYDEIIRPVFAQQLDKMTNFMDEAGIPYMDRDQDIFKIALVGGFGNFYLVKKQLEDRFKFNVYDKRREHIIRNRADCEKAISLGAALLAADVIGIRNTASYSIGVWAYDGNGKVCPNYAIRYKQDIAFNEVYYARGSRDNEIFVIQAISGGFDKFLVNFGHDDRTACFALAKKKFSQKLSNVVKNQYHTAVVGFSVDPSGVVSIHVHDYDILTGTIGEEDHEVELTRFGELFEVTKVGTMRPGGDAV